jgi:hypothetical protein
VNRAQIVAKTRVRLEKLGVTNFKAIDFRNGGSIRRAYRRDARNGPSKAQAS